MQKITIKHLKDIKYLFIGLTPAILAMILLMGSAQVFAHDGDKDKDKNEGQDKIKLYASSAIGKNSALKKFRGTAIIPQKLLVISGAHQGQIQMASLVFDGATTCHYYPARGFKIFFSHLEFGSCDAGHAWGSAVQVKKTIELTVTRQNHASYLVKAEIDATKAEERGLVLADIDPVAGQILRFDGDFWKPSDYISDGYELGQILVWDGSEWSPANPADIQALRGEAGAQGEKGDKGDPGEPGVAGAIGPQGDQGIPGVAGVDGAQGPQGLKGDKGDQGIPGVAGADGAQGLQGLVGPQGEPGLDASVNLTAGTGMVPGNIGSTGTINVDVGTGPGQIAALDSNGKLPASVMPTAAAAAPKVAFIKDIKASGTNGGGCTTGTWHTRDLNTLEGDTSFVALAGSAFTLQPGKYIISADAPAFMTSVHQAKLFNASIATDVIYGTSAMGNPSFGSVTNSKIIGEFTLVQTSTLEIRHRCAVAMNVAGFGVANSFGAPEVYTQLTLTKVE